MVYYDGVYYGDWSIVSELDDDYKSRIEEFDEAKAELKKEDTEGKPIFIMPEEFETLSQAVRYFQALIENTYGHDEDGQRIKNTDPEMSAADIVELMCGDEEVVAKAMAVINKHVLNRNSSDEVKTPG